MPGLKLRVHLDLPPSFRLAVECTLPAQGVTALHGPSGSGKTSLLNCIAGLQQADPGSEIIYNGQKWQDEHSVLPPWQRNIGFVFQDARLFPHLNVNQNLSYALNRRRQSSNISREMVIEWLDLAPLLNHPATALSAGQKQRVAIARALLSAPQLLLLDEPLANLDKASRQQCLYYLQRLRDSLELPMLYVSHDIEEVTELADHLLLLHNGSVETQGPLLELCSRLDTSLSHEEKAASIVEGTLQGHDTEFGLSELDVEGHTFYVNQLTQPVGARARLRIPARDISICRQAASQSSILNIVPVVLLEIEHTDDTRMLLKLQLGEQFLLARLTRKSVSELALKVGDSLFAQIKSVALLSDSMENTI